MSESPAEETSLFEKQRDQLVQEIHGAMDSVVHNLEILNRSLHDSIEVGKDFENVGKLWSTFYDGAEAEKRLKQQNLSDSLQPTSTTQNAETTPDEHG